MGQIQVFQCPACGGSLSYDGGPEISFACQFCGTTVVVPKELRPAGAPAAPAAAGESEQLNEVVRLVRAGKEVEAIKLMRAISPDMSLKEALAAVNQLAGPPPAPGAGGMDRRGQVVRLAQAGQEAEAAKLLRETNPGMSLQEAVVAARLLEGRPSAPAADQTAPPAEVLQLVQAGQREEAIRRLREISPGMGLTDAVREVDLLASLVGQVAAQPAGGQVSPAAVRKGAGAGGAGCTLGCIGLVVAVVAFVLAMIYLPLRLSGSYDQAVRAAQTNPDVMRAMGAPIEVVWWLPATGTMHYYSDSCSADYRIWIHGSQKSGEVWVISDSKGRTFFSEGTWTPKYVVTVYYSDTRPIWVR